MSDYISADTAKCEGRWHVDLDWGRRAAAECLHCQRRTLKVHPETARQIWVEPWRGLGDCPSRVASPEKNKAP